MEIEKKARNAEEATKEMLPFILYAAVPILITICVAYIFGVK